MTSVEERMPSMTVQVECRSPFDLGLSLRAMSGFGRSAAQEAAGWAPHESETAPILRLGVRLDGVPTLLEIGETSPGSVVMTASAHPGPAAPGALHRLAARVLNADLELQPFYDRAAGHPVLGPLTRSLRGLKAFRPASLFDMLVIAVIEQQISLLAAYRIRERLVARFGAEVEGEPVFPAPDTLAAARLEDLTACGLSARKAEYVSGLARQVAGGDLDLEAFDTMPSDEVRERIVAIRGFGPWSADYTLIRGLARPDAVPVDDLGIRTVVGTMLGDGSRPSAAEVSALLAPFAPYRGLAAFYLLVAQRLL